MQIKKVFAGICAFFLCMMNVISIAAIDDGAYVIGRSTSYVNPLSGVTQDGGTNIALGESMVGSIVESQLLVEQVNGTYYVTVGLGLASNVSNVRFQVMSANGSFYTTSATLTGSSSANGDTVNHYRIQMNSLSDYISPIIYVTPMGRDVQFFITLNTATMTPGTGVYQALMTTTTSTQSTTKKDTSSATTTTDESAVDKQDTTVDKTDEKETTKVGTLNKKSLFKGVKGLSMHTIKKETTKKKSKGTMYVVGGMIVVLLGVAGGWYYVKKVKK